MKKFKQIQWALACLACFGMVSPAMAVEPNAPATNVASQPQIVDVSLNNGALTGKVVDGNGTIEKGTTVKVSLGSKLVGSANTNENGDFVISNLKSGLYQVSTDKTQSVVRLWEGNVAPPVAKPKVLIVTGEATRAQDCVGGGGGGGGGGGFGGFNRREWAVIGIAVAALIVAIIAIADDCCENQVIVSP
ncbi:MAG: carboxypeptidase regulatory-like domain-containing protein [Planctomycetaceae bacterium]|nr:carboxypeptidase regulatory-like domain-containing protein [Planctomycetaceae bacterium]